ncbi:MAG: hypothetical protein APF80_12465 [Alphaproteobacteria bacterium BRH_c36]|nr:MAG: hypothetical protein APF80_12465 [Alphaproteobacteria bacterium BRH_c36]
MIFLVVSVGVIALSVFMNGYFAFQRLGGDANQVDLRSISIVALAGSAAFAGIDILKAFAAVFATRAWSHKNFGYVALSSFLLAGGMCLSMLSAYGFIMEQRSGVKSERVAQQETFASLSTQAADSRKRISDFGFVRPADAIEAELEAQQQQRRWDRTKGCTDATANESREFCTAYHQLKAELAQAEALKREREILEALAARLDLIRTEGGVKAVDPQLDSLAEVSGMPAGKIEFAMLVAVAVMIEFVSSFGIYLALNHGPKPAPPASQLQAAQAASPATQTLIDVKPKKEITARLLTKPEPNRLEEFSQYGLERLECADGATISLRDLHADYCAWCDRAGREAMSLREITKTLERVVGEIDEIDLTTRARKKVLLNMRLRERLAA